MERFRYVFFLKNTPIFLGVSLPIIKKLMKHGKLIRLTSQTDSGSFLHSQSIYIVLKGSLLLVNQVHHAKTTKTIASWGEGDVFPFDEKGAIFASPHMSIQSASHTILLEIPFSNFKHMMTYSSQLQMNFLVLLQKNISLFYQLFLRYLHPSSENGE
ncbi:Crp/Fnr family transcriptional regulator [Halalkalibacterium halodurans]|uniref:BH0229 protein n=1 Tax=Halalkalibacterium halodurans (strain ATCC BAA-125 / DSM 18197 / FERM 7344 / JCM 9153 / C-125) TaxID=272558 RepID=Q9KG83_HALH5|nr:transcriptional regulator [Halalkalibacterium halodurans]MED4125906.1 Crp/Fnr family transcriptional regulator [Halalkalibacterium halodurans]MED4173834.1 Crp/Fnr family transcriptional regulator [Halalkalibacterium halodurans]BAB03948.1 BH0229 [Halalkalibacterium halodurans C-125]